MILYHLSPDLSHDGKFIPRIPEDRMLDEDDTIPRICFSSSIEGCLSAMPFNGEPLFDQVMEFGGYFKLFVLDTDRHPGIIIKAPSDLFMEKKVMDAIITGEHWALSPVDLGEGHFIKILSLDETSLPYPTHEKYLPLIEKYG